MIQKCLLMMPCRFLNDLFSLNTKLFHNSHQYFSNSYFKSIKDFWKFILKTFIVHKKTERYVKHGSILITEWLKTVNSSKEPSTTKNSPSYILILFEYMFGFFICILYCLHCIIKIFWYDSTVIENFGKNGSDQTWMNKLTSNIP